MLVIRWFNAFRRVQDIRSSILYELSDPGKERAAEFSEESYTVERVERREIPGRIKELRSQGLDPHVHSHIKNTPWETLIHEIFYKENSGMFNVGSRIGFLYPNNSVRRRYWTDVWSYEAEDGSGRLKALYPGNDSDHTEAWVVGAPVGIVIRVDFRQNDKFWRKVEKTARAFANMRGIPVYTLAKSAHGLQLRRVN